MYARYPFLIFVSCGMEIPLYNVDAEFCFLHISGFWLIFFLICGLWCVAEPALVVDTIGKGGFVLLIL